MIKLQIKNVGYRIGSKQIIEDISIDVETGEFVGVIGPNGSGKSTLLKNVYRVYTPNSGRIIIDGRESRSISHKQIAQKMAVLSQENDSVFAFSVYEMVKLGRDAISSFLRQNHDDEEIIRDSLRKVDMEDFIDREFNSLSGGEKQRILIARALAQRSELIILDEPTNHLDIGCQFRIMSLIKEQQLTVFSAVHDLNMAAHFCDKIVVMDKGSVVAAGIPEDVITEELIKSVFNTNAYIDRNKQTQKINIVYAP
ncbi:MAG: ABC transporter ATP-binding protein [Oscillospiraceae bacterium]